MAGARPLGRAVAPVVAVALAASSHADALAQQPRFDVAVVGGTTTNVLGLASRAVTVAPSLVLTPDARLAFTLGGSASRFDSSQWSLGGTAAAAARAPLGAHAALTFDGAAGATNTSYGISYRTAGAIPAVEGRLGAVTLFGGAHAARATTIADTQRELPGGILGGAGGTTTDRTSVTRGVVAPLYGAVARLTSDAGETLLLSYREERMSVDAVASVDRTAGVSLARGPVVLEGAVGARRERGATTTFGSGSLSLAIGPSMALELAAGSYAEDRLTGTPGGHYLNLGVSLHFGGRTAGLPMPDGIAAAPAGMTRLVLRDERATRVELAGDFTSWTLVPARRAQNGVWYVDLAIPPGQYRYAFRVDGSTWKVPRGADVVNDGFGGKSAWLVVSGHGPRTAAR